uniref:Uncharacterized protein n=1 Tax=Ditylenchus dipsaci TaxID=166011 RepID=A0A915D4C4_9BILA
MRIWRLSLSRSDFCENFQLDTRSDSFQERMWKFVLINCRFNKEVCVCATHCVYDVSLSYFAVEYLKRNLMASEPTLVKVEVERAVEEPVISKSKQKKNKKKSKPMSDNGASSTPFVPEVSFARAAAEMDRGKRVGKSNYRGNNFRGNYSGNFNRGGYAFSNGRSRHPNAPPPISLQRRNAQGPLPTFQEVQKGQIFDYVGWMEEELRANSPEHVYNADFPPLSAESGKGKGSGPLTGSGSSDLLERSNNNLGSLNSPSGANSNNMRCSEQASFVMMPNTVFPMPNDVYQSEPLVQYVDTSMVHERDEVIKRQIEFYFSAYN